MYLCKAKRIGVIIAILTLFGYGTAYTQSATFFGVKEHVPVIPPKDRPIRVLIASDAKNEIDDMWAIALVLLYPERFKIEGFVGGNYDHTKPGIGPSSVGLSVKEINTLLEMADMKARYPVYAGSHPMQYEFSPGTSEGVDFIIERALAGTPEDPLWIIGLGSATDIASAYLKEPSICNRIVVFWHARTHLTWPHRAHNYNVKGDMHAARMMFHAPFPLVLFDAGTNLTAGTLEESETYIKPYGKLGEYLYRSRLTSPHFSSTAKSLFDLGDIAVLIDPEIGQWQDTLCPSVTPYMDYNFEKHNGRLLRCFSVNRDKAYRLLYDRIKEKFPFK